MKKLMACAITGAIVAQIWGTISWMLLPWHNSEFKKFQDPSVVATAIGSQAKETGLYMLPNYDESYHENEKPIEEWKTMARKGPFSFLVVRPNGVNPDMGLPMALTLLSNFIIAAGLFWLLSQTKITDSKQKILFLSIAGGLGAIYPHVANIVWWHYPVTFVVISVIDLFLLWALAGSAMVLVDKKMTAKSQ